MNHDDPPGLRCDSCRQNIDARLDVLEHRGRWYCDDECRRRACLGEAEQMQIGDVK